MFNLKKGELEMKELSIKVVVSEEKYNEMMQSLHNIDLSKVLEHVDNTNLMGEAACAGGACEIG